ncbi:MAG: YfhO family protein [Rikenellaceae bacterium]|nr:YfhO family protein [Rikenellaceae bacterium]MCL2692868.1 YfhO family protein [Rikenellaceae bacterium]
MMKKVWPCIAPYIVAIATFAAAAALYFAPQFEGRELTMHDITQYEGSSRDIDLHRERFGEDPQWTGNSFSGMPASLISMQYPGQILKRVSHWLEFMGRPASLIFLAMVGFFVMLLMFRVNAWVAIPMSLAYGFSTYFIIIIGAGHITKMIACAYAPLVVGSVRYALRRNIWLGASLTAFFGSLLIAANHPQIVYYFAFVVAALWINELVRAVKKNLLPRFWRATAAIAVAGVLALGSNLAPMWFINEWSKDSIRGGSELTLVADAPTRGAGLDLDYATAWSYGIGETFNLYIPGLYGGSADFAPDGEVADALARYGARGYATHLLSYWGDQPGTAGPTYLGAVALFFAVLALFMLPRRKTLWIVAVSLLAIMLAWGHNFMWLTKLFFYYFPGYDKFRAVATMLVIAQWAVPLLGALGLARLWRDEVKFENVKKSLKPTVLILGGISLVFMLFGRMLFDFVSPYDANMGLPEDVLAAMRSERAAMMRADALRSLVFVALAAGVVWLYMRGRLKRGVMVVLAAALVCADLVPIGMRYLSHSDFTFRRGARFVATDADRLILQDIEPGFRVFNVANGISAAFNEANTSYFHRSVGGYHGAKLQRYQDVIDRYLVRADMNVLNMLNVRYFIMTDEQGQPPVAVPNPDAFGAAWFVERVVVAENADEEIAALGVIDLSREAVVDRRFAHLLSPAATATVDSAAHITLVEFRPNYFRYEYATPYEATAVFSEIFYARGWRAYIDGVPAEHFRVNYILRGMVLPAGEHSVEFRFRAHNFNLISNITLVFSLLIIAALAASIAATVLCRKRKRKET